MVHVRFDPDSVNWQPFFAAQSLQYGGSYFEGLPYQRGYGIGSVFRSLYRYLLPATKEIGREGMALGARFLGDMVEGKKPKESLIVESKAGLKNLLKKGADKLQEGGGRKRRTRKSINTAPKLKKKTTKKKIVGRIVRRNPIKGKEDIFDFER